MHRSRIAVVLIDHPGETFAQAEQFWQRARGGEPTAVADDDGPYTSLPTLPGAVMLEVQRLQAGSPRVHLDIETDDVAAEIDRLVVHGASVQQRRDDYAVLADPGGLVFCVVPVQTPTADFEAHATRWD